MTHTPNAIRFCAEYPTPVNHEGQRDFCAICQTPEIEARVFASLDRWKRSDRWRRGYIKDAANWFRSGDYAIEPPGAPKAWDGSRRLPTREPVPEPTPENIRQAEAEWIEIRAKLGELAERKAM